jgi:succinyl-CoA synthetase alpha subunit
VPLLDAAQIHAYARVRHSRIVGPTSVGVINPGARVKIGPIGGINVDRVYKPGPVGVMSKSGGMTTETSWIIRQAGYGISTAMGIGGDFIKGGNFVDLLPLFFADSQTKAIVIFGEPGGGDEEALAEYVTRYGLQKPIIAFISGRFVDHMPQGVQFGHAGAVVERGVGSPAMKIATLRKAGVLIAEVQHEIGTLLQEVLG